MYEHVEEVYDGAAVGASQSASLSMVAAAVSWKNTSSDMLCQICCVRSIISNLPAPRFLPYRIVGFLRSITIE